jgi:hypothetical protein
VISAKVELLIRGQEFKIMKKGVYLERLTGIAMRIALAPLVCLPVWAWAQSGTVTAGRDFSNGTVKWSYTLGQPFHLQLGSVSQPRLNQGIQQTYQDNKITGLLRYDNTALTPMNNCAVQLRTLQSVIAASATTLASGAYELNAFPDGSYNLSASSTKPWGGVNATDALRVRQYFTGAAPLAGIRLAVADVNASNSINSNDALLITRRFSNLPASFSGDWYFETVPVTANGQTQVINLKGLTYGDVNGSYIPSSARQPVRLDMAYDEVRFAGDELQWLPVYADRALEMGAVSVVVHCPAGIEVVDVRSVLSREELLWNYRDGEFRLGWSHVAGKFLSRGEPLFELKVKGHSRGEWEMQGLSEIADLNAAPLEMVQLRIPKVLPASQGWHVAISPNPASNESYLDFDFPSGSGPVHMELLDSRGRAVWVENLSSLAEGRHRHQLPSYLLAEGRYLVRVQAQIGKESGAVHQNLSLIIRR